MSTTSPNDPAPATRDSPAAGRRWITAALMLVMVLASMEATITSTTMPTIVGALHGLHLYSWVTAIYLLASTLTMPLYGKLADHLGRKKILLAAIFIFLAGSILASLSHSMLQLILFRGIQGLGAGGIMPIVLTILGDIFTLHERAQIQGLFSAVWGTASLAGPALGAFLVTTDKLAPRLPSFLHPFLGWPSIFWINLPTAALAIAVLITKYHDHHHAQAHPPHTPAPPSLGALVPQSLSASSPSTLRLLASRAILPSLLVSALLGTGVFTIDVFVPLYVQGARAGTAASAALAVTPVMLAWATSSLFAAPLVIKWGFRKLATVGSLLILVGFLGLLAAALTRAPLPVLTALLFITGFGFGPSSMACLLNAQNSVPYQKRGLVTSAITLTRNLGGAAAILSLGALFNALTLTDLATITHNHFAPADLLAPERLKDIQQQFPTELTAAQSTISHALIWIFVCMLISALAQVITSRYISASKHDHKPTPTESLDTIAA